MIASMQRNARFDDLAETMGMVTSARTASGGVMSVAMSAYDEQIEVKWGVLVEGYPYFIETEDGRAFSGRLDTEGRPPRIYTDDANNYAVFWGDDALVRRAGM
jgi:hypothetical protein